ncbi:MAG: dipeptide epimerase [Synechococcales cyanobacterium]
MDWQWHPLTVHKRVPLTISRGTSSHSQALWIQVEHEGLCGWGEAQPFAVGSQTAFTHADSPAVEHLRQTHELLRQGLSQASALMADLDPWQEQEWRERWRLAEIPSAVRAGMDMALWDWRGKKVGLPLWQWWGLDPGRAVPISVTIGISEPDAAVARLQQWWQVIPPEDLGAIKLKLGNPVGIPADQALVTAVLAELSPGVKISVDANGGWTVADTLRMAEWLAERGVSLIEQPLPRGQEEDLATLHEHCALPIYVDESCWVSQDIPQLAEWVQGITIKLMKSSGLSGALELIHTARAHGLGIMLGCYGDTALANTAATHLGSLADHLDLDSHLNLLDDPFLGASLVQGRLIPPSTPGLGVTAGIPFPGRSAEE